MSKDRNSKISNKKTYRIDRSRILKGCQKQVAARINHLKRMGRFDENRYARRIAVENEFEAFMQNEYPCFLLTGRSGSGKTFTFCQLAKLYAMSQPVLFFPAFFIEVKHRDDFIRMIAKEITEAAHEYGVEWPDTLELLEDAFPETSEYLIIFVEGLNEAKNRKLLESSLRCALDFITKQGIGIRLCISCRDDVWKRELEKSQEWRGFIYTPKEISIKEEQRDLFMKKAKKKPSPDIPEQQNFVSEDQELVLGLTIGDFTDDELKEATSCYNLQCQFGDQAREILKFPILLSIFAQTYPDCSGQIDVVATRILFDEFIKRKCFDIKNKENLDLENFLTPILDCMWKSHSLYVSFEDINEISKKCSVSFTKEILLTLETEQIISIDLDENENPSYIRMPEPLVHYLLAWRLASKYEWHDKDSKDAHKDFFEVINPKELKLIDGETVVHLILQIEGLKKNPEDLLHFFIERGLKKDDFDRDQYFEIACKAIQQMEMQGQKSILQSVIKMISACTWSLKDTLARFGTTLSTVVRSIEPETALSVLEPLIEDWRCEARASLIVPLIDLMFDGNKKAEKFIHTLWAQLPETLDFFDENEIYYKDIQEELTKCFCMKVGDSLERYEAVIRDLLCSKNPGIRRAVAYAAGRGYTINPETAINILKKLAVDECGLVRAAAASSMKVVLDENKEDGWEIAELLAKDVYHEVRHALLFTLIEIKKCGYKVVNLIKKATKHQEYETRIVCAHVLLSPAGLSLPGAEELILILAKDEDIRVRQAVLKSAIKWEDSLFLSSTFSFPLRFKVNEDELLGMDDQDSEKTSYYLRDEPSPHAPLKLLLKIMDIAINDMFTEPKILAVIGCLHTLEKFRDRTISVLKKIAEQPDKRVRHVLAEFCNQKQEELGSEMIEQIIGPLPKEEKVVIKGEPPTTLKDLVPVIGLSTAISGFFTLILNFVFSQGNILSILFSKDNGTMTPSIGAMIFYGILISFAMGFFVNQLHETRLTFTWIGTVIGGLFFLILGLIFGNSSDSLGMAIIGICMGTIFADIYSRSKGKPNQIAQNIGYLISTLLMGSVVGGLAGIIIRPSARFAFCTIFGILIGLSIYFVRRWKENIKRGMCSGVPIGLTFALGVWGLGAGFNFLLDKTGYFMQSSIVKPQQYPIFIVVVVGLWVLITSWIGILFARKERETTETIFFVLIGAVTGLASGLWTGNLLSLLLLIAIGAGIGLFIYLIFYNIIHLFDSFYRAKALKWLLATVFMPSVVGGIGILGWFWFSRFFPYISSLSFESSIAAYAKILGWIGAISFILIISAYIIASEEFELSNYFGILGAGVLVGIIFSMILDGWLLMIILGPAGAGVAGAIWLIFYGIDDKEPRWIWLASFLLTSIGLVILCISLLGPMIGILISGGICGLIITYIQVKYGVLLDRSDKEKLALNLDTL